MLTDKDVQAIRARLEGYGQRIVEAQTKEVQRSLLGSLHEWLREEARKWTTRETGPQLARGVFVYDRETGERVEWERLWAEPNDVLVEIVVDCNRSGQYERIGAIRFSVRDPSVVHRFLR